MRALAVYCGSSMGKRPEYRRAAEESGRLLAQRSIEVVYGGAQIGLMGAVADAALAAGGRVVGIIPGPLGRKEIIHEGLTETLLVPTMHERKAKMAALADGFMALPGGIGTLDEWCEIVGWATLGIHRKPIGVLNTRGYYDPLLAMLDHAIEEGFLRPAYRDYWVVADTPEALLSAMEDQAPPHAPEWLKWDEV